MKKTWVLPSRSLQQKRAIWKHTRSLSSRRLHEHRERRGWVSQTGQGKLCIGGGGWIKLWITVRRLLGLPRRVLRRRWVGTKGRGFVREETEWTQPEVSPDAPGLVFKAGWAWRHSLIFQQAATSRSSPAALGLCSNLVPSVLMDLDLALAWMFSTSFCLSSLDCSFSHSSSSFLLSETSTHFVMGRRLSHHKLRPAKLSLNQTGSDYNLLSPQNDSKFNVCDYYIFILLPGSC